MLQGRSWRGSRCRPWLGGRRPCGGRWSWLLRLILIAFTSPFAAFIVALLIGAAAPFRIEIVACHSELFLCDRTIPKLVRIGIAHGALEFRKKSLHHFWCASLESHPTVRVRKKIQIHGEVVHVDARSRPFVSTLSFRRNILQSILIRLTSPENELVVVREESTHVETPKEQLNEKGDRDIEVDIAAIQSKNVNPIAEELR